MERRQADAEAMRKAEAARQEKEEREREEARLREIRDKMELENIKRLLVLSGQDPSKVLVKDGGMAGVDRAALEKDVREKALKAREEETRKRGDQVRRADYLARATREAERSRAADVLARQVAEDAAFIASAAASAADKARARHEAAMGVKTRLVRMVPYQAQFEAAVLARRRAAGAAEHVSSSRAGGAPIAAVAAPPPPAPVKSILAALP